MFLRAWKRFEKATFTRVKRKTREVWHNRSDIRLKDVGDPERYRQTQSAGNKRKIDNVFVRDETISLLSDFAVRRIGRRDLRVLCHGTRNGAEQKLFRRYLPHATGVLGTEISDTATMFPDTVQWDFHDAKPEWMGAWDVIYSNSWDHAHDPHRAFRSWMSCLSGDGLLFLEHTRFHTPAYVSELDPFGATLDGLRRIVVEAGAGNFRDQEVLSGVGARHHVLVVGRVQAAGMALSSGCSGL